MRKSVAAAWPAHISSYEGRCNFLYLDVKKLATTGVGYLCDSIPASQALPWLTYANSPATPAETEADFRRVKARTDLAPKGGYAYRGIGTLHLAEPDIDALLMKTTVRFWTRLLETLPDLEAYPADAQLAILDLSYQNGPAFLDTKSGGQYVWAGTRAAVLAQDWAAAATHVPGTATSRRAITRRRLFTNAAKVKSQGLDPEPLWNETAPTAPAPPPVVVSPPVATPPKEPVLHSNTYKTDYVSWRGGYFTPTDRDILLAIPSNVRVTQGGLSFAPASAKTHAGLGAFDLNTDGMTKAEVWQLSSELLECGIIAFPRGFVWDSFQGKTIANTNDGNEHLHCVSNESYDHLHPEAQAQVREFKRFRAGDSRDGNGLVSSAPYTGPSTPLGSWAKSQYNPRSPEGRRLAKIKADKMAEELRKKELELPTTKEVWNDDIIPAPDDAKDLKTNPTWRPASFLRETLRVAKEINAKLDILIKAQKP